MAAPPTSVRTIVDGSGAGSIGSEVPSRWIATKPFSKNRNSRNRMRLTEERLNISECDRYATQKGSENEPPSTGIGSAVVGTTETINPITAGNASREQRHVIPPTSYRPSRRARFSVYPCCFPLHRFAFRLMAGRIARSAVVQALHHWTSTATLANILNSSAVLRRCAMSAQQRSDG